MNIVVKIPDSYNEKILTLPFLQSLHNYFEDKDDDYNLHIITTSDGMDVLNLLPFEAYYHEVELADLKNPFTAHRASNEMKIFASDIFINLTNSTADGSIGYWLKSKKRIGFDSGLAKFFYTDKVRRLLGRHPNDIYKHLFSSYFPESKFSKRNISRELERPKEEDNYFIIDLSLDFDWSDFFELVENKTFYLIGELSDSFPKKNIYKTLSDDIIEQAKVISYADFVITNNLSLMNLSSFLGAYCFYTGEVKVDLEGPNDFLGAYELLKGEAEESIFNKLHKYINREQFND